VSEDDVARRHGDRSNETVAAPAVVLLASGSRRVKRHAAGPNGEPTRVASTGARRVVVLARLSRRLRSFLRTVLSDGVAQDCRIALGS
jgi:hypothetical protein